MAAERAITSLRLMIVDSDSAFRSDLRSTLENAGYRVVGEAGDGVTAVAAARQLAPDLVISDIKMSRLDGFSIARILSHERIAPIVLLTAYSDARLVKQAVEAGVHSYLTKPCHAPALLAAIEVTHSRWRQLVEQERKVRRLQEKEETREVVGCAKRVLMATCGMSELRAHRYIQMQSMNRRRPMREIAAAILISHHTVRTGVLRHLTDAVVAEEVA